MSATVSPKMDDLIYACHSRIFVDGKRDFGAGVTRWLLVKYVGHLAVCSTEIQSGQRLASQWWQNRLKAIIMKNM